MRKILKTFVPLLAIAIFLTGCPSPFFDRPVQKPGTVRVTIGGSAARTFMPSEYNIEKLSFVLIFTPGAGNDNDPVKVVVEEGKLGADVPLNTGLWELEVYGFSEPVLDPDNIDISEAWYERDEDTIGTPNLPFSVSPIGTTVINVKLKAIPENIEEGLTQDDKGTLDYKIEVPVGAEWEITLEKSVTAISIFLDSENDPPEDKIELDSGFWDIFVLVKYDGKEKTEVGLAQIYDNAITKAEFDLSDDNEFNEALEGITEFGFTNLFSYIKFVEIDTIKTDILVFVPPKTPVTNLEAEIVFKGAMIDPAPEFYTDFSVPREYKIYSEGGSFVTYTVKVKDTISDAAILEEYLAACVEDNVSEPVAVKLLVNDFEDSWPDFLSAIEDAGLNIDLDLSLCTGIDNSGSDVFDPGTENTGEEFIVSLTLPDCAVEIAGGTGSPTFKNFINLENITGNYIETIGEYAFSGLNSLETVDFPALAFIDDYSFYKSGLTGITIPDNTNNDTFIGDYAFRECFDLVTAILGSGTVSIGTGAFSFTNLEEISFPNTVVSIGDSVFNGVDGLILSINKTTIDNDWSEVFNGSSNLEVIFGPEVNGIPDYLFYGCETIAAVTIPGSVLSIGDYAFNGCSSLVEVEISTGVTVIGSSAFSGCVSLTEIYLPDSISIVKDSVFEGCTALSIVNIPNGVQKVESSTFGSCSSLMNITIPSSVTEIDNGAFRNSGLTGISFPVNLTRIGDNAFRNCVYLGAAGIIIPDSVTEIGDYAFNNCISLKSLTIGEDVTTIGISAFTQTVNLDRVTFNCENTKVLCANDPFPGNLWELYMNQDNGHDGIGVYNRDIDPEDNSPSPWTKQ